MEPGKKINREDEGKVDGKKGKGLTEGEGRLTVKEEEVEEFFAILRRVHAAVKHFEKGNGGGERRKLPAKRKRSRSLGSEDHVETNGVQNGEDREEVRVGFGYSGLDLNSAPEPLEELEDFDRTKFSG